MKHSINCLFIVAALLASGYFIGVFVEASFDISLWRVVVRENVAKFMLVAAPIFLFVYAMYNDDKK